MNILTSFQIREADAFSIQKQKISSAELMERAAGCCFQWIIDHFGIQTGYQVFCGNGNNGGDGLVIARMLHEAGARTAVWLRETGNRSVENMLNLERIQKMNIPVHTLSAENLSKGLPDGDIWIDALLGSGLRLPLQEDLAGILQEINRKKPISHSMISIDCPSGFDPDAPLPDHAVAIMADYTLCFHCPRLMFFFSESEKYTGRWEILDIGLEIPSGSNSLYSYLLKQELNRLLQPRNTFSYKGSFGHALIAGGSSGHSGAIIMTAKACLRSGVGLVTAILPPVCAIPFQSTCMEAMTLISGESMHLASIPLKTDRYSVLAFGPGAGIHEDTARLLKYLIQEAQGPMVIDADGINILSKNKTWLSFIPPYSILTPHVGEFDRLAGKSATAYERHEKAKEISRKNNLIIVLKDAFTRIVMPDGRVFFNSTGNPGMATAGSGDVLTGLITGLLAQGMTPEDAAKTGVFLHGLAGDIAAERNSMQGMIAGDIILSLPEAWKRFQS